MTASYDVRISARAERDLLRLPDKIGAACVAFIFGLMSERTPHHEARPIALIKALVNAQSSIVDMSG